MPINLKETVEKLIIAAGNGHYKMAELEAAKGSLIDLGYSSLAFTNLMVLIEEQLGVPIDPSTDPEELSSVDGIIQFAQRELGESV